MGYTGSHVVLASAVIKLFTSVTMATDFYFIDDILADRYANWLLD